MTMEGHEQGGYLYDEASLGITTDNLDAAGSREICVIVLYRFIRNAMWIHCNTGCFARDEHTSKGLLSEEGGYVFGIDME